jgi:hypothetical protein
VGLVGCVGWVGEVGSVGFVGLLGVVVLGFVKRRTENRKLQRGGFLGARLGLHFPVKWTQNRSFCVAEKCVNRSI